MNFTLINAQIIVSGQSLATSIQASTATAVAPDLTISASAGITDFTVSVIDSYSNSDQLSYPTGTLPSGVTGIPWSTTTRSIVFKGTKTASEWQSFLRTVTITSGSVCSPETRKVSFAAGETYYNPLNGHFYRLTATQSSWTNSQNTASSTSYYGREGYLVTLTSDAENTFVTRLVGQDSWMGASDDYLQINNALGYIAYANQSASEGKFYWVTGPEKGTQLTTNNGNGNTLPGVYQKWRNGEPNNSGVENFGHVYAAAGDWNDFRDTQTIFGIMEFGDMPNDVMVSAPQFSKHIFIQGSSSGSISGGDNTVCGVSNSTTLTLNGLSGIVVGWESSTNNFITPGISIANTTTNLTVSNLTETTYYRAVVISTSPISCNGLVTSSTAIFVDDPTPGNVFADNTTLCAGSDVELYVSGQEGTVQKWQRSTDNSNWTDIANTNTMLIEAVPNTGTLYYRVLVEIIGCGSSVASPSKEITVVSGTAPTGGQVSSATQGSVTNNGILALTGHTGTIVKWQRSEDNGIIWSDIANTTTTYTYSNIATNSLFRAQLTNGSCGNAFSAEGSVIILDPPSISSFTPVLAGSGETVTISGTGFTGTTSVSFGASAAFNFTVVSDAVITATVGMGSSGAITVTNPAASDSKAGFIYKVAQYDFEDDVLDATDNNYDGTEINAVTYQTGAQGQAICFDNGPGYVKLPDNLIRSLSEFTISLRFKTTGTGSILGYQNVTALTPSPSEWIPILLITSDGKLKGTLWTGPSGAIQAISANAVNDGNWHQVDFVGDTNTVSIYLDGNLEASQSGASVVHLSMIYNQLGLSYTNAYNTPTNTTWEYFEGCIDDLVIIDRALTALEIEEVTALPEPTIDSFTPTDAGEEDTVVVTGTNFDGATQVTFGGEEALSYTVDSSTQITATLENGASGAIEITTAGGTASANGFTFTSKTSINNSVSTLDEIIYCGGEASAPISFDVSATDIYQDLVITAPTGFEVSVLSEGPEFSSSITLTPSANEIVTTAVQVRVAESQYGRLSGNITISAGSVSENISITAATNNSLYFDGVNDYVDMSGNSLQDGTTAFTIEAWILPDNSNYDGSYHAIFGRQSSGSPTSRNPSFYIKDGKIHVDSYEDNTNTRFDILTDEALIAQNVWSHIALVKQGTVFTVYVNGVSEFTTGAPNAVNMVGPYQIGFIDNYFAGKIDDVRFWNVSRTASEIANNIDTALTGNETGLVGHYTFNEGVADGTNTGLTTLADNSPSNIDGTLLNMTLSGSTSNWVQGYFPQISGSSTVAVGAQIQLAHLESGGVWSSSAAGIATVNQSGLVSGVAEGSVEISYALCAQTTVKILEVDNPATFPVSETALTISEDDGTGTFTVVLGSEPTNTVVISITSDDTDEATVDVAQLTFTAANWNTIQTVTVTGVDDAVVADDTAIITVSINAASSDNAFDALQDKTVAITLTNDDANFTFDTITDTAIGENVVYTSETPSLSGDTPMGALAYTLGGADAADFTINETTGVVSMVARNFEAPEDDNTDNVYEVSINTTDDEGNTDSEDWTVTVDDVTETVSFTIDTIADANLDENATYTGPTPNITGSPIGNIIYTLGGTDAADFTIASSTGVIFMDARDFENSDDNNTDNVYEVTINATDDDSNTTSEEWTVTVNDVTETVSFTIDAISNETIDEETPYTGPVPSITGSPIGNVTYTAGGADVAIFNIDSSNGVVVMPLRSYENPDDVNGDNIYEVTITATDEDGNSASEDWTISLLDVVETASFSIGTIADVNIEENSTFTSETLNISGNPIGTVTYSLGGTDMADFTINSTTGVFSMTARDFEIPMDADTDNSYEVTIIATDEDSNTASVAWTVTIQNVDEGDTDSDGDGTPDSEDAFPNDPNENTDTDGDGTGDNADTDDDDDGTPDSEDDFPFDENEDTDTDGDGTGDNADEDTDGDGIPDSLDADINGDGLLDNGTDSDGDGINDANDDNDDRVDSDGDGVPDADDAFPNDPTESQDSDGDGIGSNTDLDDNDATVGEEQSVVSAEAFTPNGDGINDTWMIKDIENHPNAMVTVYNRYGHEVFRAVGYQNDWNGRYNSRSENLPAGSYYYVIDFNNGTAPKNGWIFLNY